MVKTRLRGSSLVELVQSAARYAPSFSSLDPRNQRGILDYIQEKGLGIKVFKAKWYDILSNKFFAEEYLSNENSPFGINIENREFCSFSEFFEYVGGDVYHDCCLYGYAFSGGEIERYSLDTKLLNFDALINETVNEGAFDTMRGEIKEEASYYARKAASISKWFRNFNCPSTLQELEDGLQKFRKKFSGYDEQFFSTLFRKGTDAIRKPVIEFLCKNGPIDGLDFETILLTYGTEAAAYVIENYQGNGSEFQRDYEISNFREFLHLYDGDGVQHKQSLGFSLDSLCYYVTDIYFERRSNVLMLTRNFWTFDEFVSFVNGDLSNADLTYAPIPRGKVAEYKTNANTELSFPKKYDRYRVDKKFENGSFIVIERWLDLSGQPLYDIKHDFSRFFDFVHFLKGDLSGADLLDCEGVENLSKVSGLNLKGLKVRSEIAEKLGLPLRIIGKETCKTETFPLIQKNEVETKGDLTVDHYDNDGFSDAISYVSDIHLFHRFKAYGCRTLDDAAYVTRRIAKTLREESTSVNLIAGDTASSFDVFAAFIDEITSQRIPGHFFFTLGNHELWDSRGESLEATVERYRVLLTLKTPNKMHFVQNNIFWLDRGWEEITEEELTSISPEDLRSRLRTARLIIFGGIGFAGTNDKFNANNGIYQGAIDREQEVSESRKFRSLYEKVITSLKGKNVIVLTHMPLIDWAGQNAHPAEGIVYVSGHNHRNYFYDDRKTRVCADNQIGYSGKGVSFKRIAVHTHFDWFAGYEDGIHEITREDYQNFYRGAGFDVTFRRPFQRLFMIKRDGVYMFLLQNRKGYLYVLNRGAMMGVGDHSIFYFYDNLPAYVSLTKKLLSKYSDAQMAVSREIKKIGGSGFIHGCIVDINYFNHLYVNPFDGKVVPYFAYSTSEKYVYQNLPSLLKYECPDLFDKFQKLVHGEGNENALLARDKSLPIVAEKQFIPDTNMYGVSYVMKRFQPISSLNIVRTWNEAILSSAPKEIGKMIELEMIALEPREKPVKEPRRRISEPKEKKIVLSHEEKVKARQEKYAAMVREKTGGKILVKQYRGGVEKADYECTECGYAWSTRPDHFKDRQRFRCPKCKAGKEE